MTHIIHGEWPQCLDCDKPYLPVWEDFLIPNQDYYCYDCLVEKYPQIGEFYEKRNEEQMDKMKVFTRGPSER